MVELPVKQAELWEEPGLGERADAARFGQGAAKPLLVLQPPPDDPLSPTPLPSIQI